MTAAFRPQRVCVIGLWHLGSVTATCLAKLGHQVTGVDEDAARVAGLLRGEPPLFEPGLAELIRAQLGEGRLTFTADLEAGVREAEVVMVTYDTPVNAQDELDVTPVTKAMEAAGRAMRPEALVIIESQVPVGTCHRLQATLRRLNPRWSGHLACVPENLRLGQAIERFLAPAMVIVGADDAATRQRVETLLAGLSSPRRLAMDLVTAEMTKHALNAFFATCVSFANELGGLCEAVGADGMRIGEAMRCDERIGPKALVLPGAPFGGGTLARDVNILRGVGRAEGHGTSLMDAVLAVNERQKDLVRWCLRRLWGTLRGRAVGVLGLTYKAGTSTLRRSPSLELIARLQEDGAEVRAYDPKADLTELNGAVTFRVCGSPSEVAEGADALVIATEWPEFKQLDWTALRPRLRTPILVDTKNLLVPAEVTVAGFRYFGVGRGVASDAQGVSS